jgi:MYXO-CTERM domain-containing protein
MTNTHTGRWSGGAGVAAGISLAVLLALAGRAGAEDIGQIAVIEDTTGQILPASGLCNRLMYPNSLCSPRGGEAFYATHPDNYDILVFTTNKNTAASEKAGYPLQADVHGIGQDTVPWSYTHFGSAGRLLQAVDLGALQTLPDDPEGIFAFIPMSGLEVVGHEIAHHWLAYANVDLGDGRGSLDILRGYADTGPITHWSCRFNTDSVMYGGMLTDNGGGSFTDVNGPRKYAPLDQYLMGLRAPEEVGPLWFVADGGNVHGCQQLLQERGVPVDLTGTRVDFTVDDVIRALGPRDPPTSPCHYKVAFVFVHRPGEPPTTEELDKFERYRTALETWYAWATDDRGSLDTRLDGCGTGTAGCPGEQTPGCEPPADDDDAGADADADSDADADGDDVVPPDDVTTDVADARDDAGRPDGSTGDDDGGGCGCRAATNGSPSRTAWVALGLLAFLWRRGKRR